MYREGTLTFQHCLSSQYFLYSALYLSIFLSIASPSKTVSNTVSINILTILLYLI